MFGLKQSNNAFLLDFEDAEKNFLKKKKVLVTLHINICLLKSFRYSTFAKSSIQTKVVKEKAKVKSKSHSKWPFKKGGHVKFQREQVLRWWRTVVYSLASQYLWIVWILNYGDGLFQKKLFPFTSAKYDMKQLTSAKYDMKHLLVGNWSS